MHNFHSAVYCYRLHNVGIHTFTTCVLDHSGARINAFFFILNSASTAKANASTMVPSYLHTNIIMYLTKNCKCFYSRKSAINTHHVVPFSRPCLLRCWASLQPDAQSFLWVHHIPIYVHAIITDTKQTWDDILNFTYTYLQCCAS